jgi:hypothetical protein
MKTFVPCGLLFVMVTVAGCGGFRSGGSPVLVRPYDIVVLDYKGGADGRGLLFRVNPLNGIRTVVNNFGDATQGPVVPSPRGIAVEASGQILVIDYNAGTDHKGALFRVDPQSKRRTLLSDFGNPWQSATPETPLGHEPGGVAVEVSRNILVVDQDAGTDLKGALFRVHPDVGFRELLSDFGNPGQGLLGSDPYDVTVEADGTILVVDQVAKIGDGFGGGTGALFRVDPVTGMRTPLTFFYTGTPVVWSPDRVAVGADGSILVTDTNKGVWRADPQTRSLTLLSSYAPIGQLKMGVRPYDIAVEPGGTIVVVDPEYCESCPSGPGVNRRGALLRGDPNNKPLPLTVVSNFGFFLPSENLGEDPLGVAILPR